MAGTDQASHAFDQGFVVDDILKAVIERSGVFFDRQIDIDPDGLLAPLLVAMNADFRLEYEVSHKDMTDAALGIGEAKRLDFRGAGHSGGAPLADFHVKCAPPSSAIICPVIAGAASIYRMASQISCGDEPRPSGVAAHCRAKSAAL